METFSFRRCISDGIFCFLPARKRTEAGKYLDEKA